MTKPKTTKTISRLLTEKESVELTKKGRWYKAPVIERDENEKLFILQSRPITTL